MTLTETAALTKKILVGSVILLFLVLGGWIGFRIYYYNYYLPSLPKVEEQPELKFGALPQLDIPESASASANLQYQLDTETGGLPENLPKLIKVYFIPQLSTTLLAPDRAKRLAADLKFPLGPEIVSSTVYRFTDEKGGVLTVDLNSSNFAFRRPLATSSADFVDERFNEDEVKKDFIDYLSEKGLLKEQLINGNTAVLYDSDQVSKRQSAVVSLWQQNIDEHPIITSAFTHANIKATVTKFTTEPNKYLRLDYFYWPIDKENFSTYPIKTADQAYQDLQVGKGRIYKLTESSPVSIINVYLAYYLPENYAPYLQPVYVFEGDNFAAIVPAIVDEYVDLENP